jgi:hypothetical protein
VRDPGRGERVREASRAGALAAVGLAEEDLAAPAVGDRREQRALRLVGDEELSQERRDAGARA